MGTTTVDDLKAMIQMNLIKNNEGTMDDANLASKAYGPDVGEMKGKTTRVRPTPVVSNIVEIPENFLGVHKYLTFLMDVLAANSLKFLPTISHTKNQLLPYTNNICTNCWKSTRKVVLISPRSTAIINFAK